MKRHAGRLSLLTIGLPMLLALVLGGGTMPGTLIDPWLLLVLALGALVELARAPSRDLSRGALPLVALPVLVVAWQLLPLPLVGATQNVLPLELSSTLASVRPLTLDIAATWDAALWTATLCLFLLVLLRTDAAELRGRTTFVFVAVAIHIVVGLMQFAGAVPLRAPVLGYTPTAGFFANENHLATFLVMSIPLAFAYLGQFGTRWLVGLYVSVVLGMLAVAGSAMGMMLGVAATTLSLFLFGDVRARVGPAREVGRWRVVASGVVVALLVGATAFVAWRVANDSSSGGTRLSYAEVTLGAIADNLPFGTGFGTFAPVYERYDAPERIGATFVNEAHNEYLQLALVGGLPAIIVAALVVWILAGRARESWHLPLTKASVIALGLLAVHSAIDYPLRTLSVSVLAVFLIAALFERLPRPRGAHHEGEGRALRRTGTRPVPPATPPSTRPVASARPIAPHRADDRVAEPTDAPETIDA